MKINPESGRKRKPRVAFFGGGEIGRGFLQRLVALRDAGKCDLVGAHPSHIFEGQARLIEPLARANGVPLLAQPGEVLRIGSLDVILSAGNHFRFTLDYIEKPRVGIINFHAAPLPDYRGSACPAFAILNGERQFGVTFHKVVEELDAGPILHAERFPIDRIASAGDVDHMCVKIGLKAFARHAERFLSGDIEEQPQTADARPYKRTDIEPYRRVDLSWRREKIWDHVRACDWDGVLEPAYVELGSDKIYLTTKVRGSRIGGGGSVVTD